MNIEDFVGRLTIDQTGHLLEVAWGVASTENKEDFVKSHRSELEELLPEVLE